MVVLPPYLAGRLRREAERAGVSLEEYVSEPLARDL